MRTKRVARNKALALGLLFVAALLAACLLLFAAKPAHADTTFTVDRSDDPDLTSTPTADDCTEATATDCASSPTPSSQTETWA